MTLKMMAMVDVTRTFEHEKKKKKKKSDQGPRQEHISCKRTER